MRRPVGLRAGSGQSAFTRRCYRMLPGIPRGLTPPGTPAYHARMNPELERLEQQLDRLIAAARRLADENAALRRDLAAAREQGRELEHRMDEARERVRGALARLPAEAADPELD